MSRRKKDPSYRLHRQSGQAIITLPDGMGGRHDVLLGPHDSPESWEAYNRVLTEWKANGRRLPTTPGQKEPDLTINELILRFWPHVEEHYRRLDGTPTSEVEGFRLSMKPLKRLYGRTLAKDFGPLALKAVRQTMMDGSWLTEEEKAERVKKGKRTDWSRGLINQRVGRIKSMFRWGVENELVPAAVLQGLQAVRGLAKGRSKARETARVKPVPETFVRETIPFLLPPVAAMVELQLATGMRPGEVVIMRGIDLDTSGKVWLYRPGSDQGEEGTHKTAWRGQQRVIAIGPCGQELLRPWLRLNLQEYLFSPREAIEAYRAERRKNRKTRVPPSQQNRRNPKSKKAPGHRYNTCSYGQAIGKACRKADRAAHERNPEIHTEHVIVPKWHPHQLRHTKATQIRREAGLDAARVVLGHRSPKITETYAEIDVNKAAEVMAKLG